MNSDKELNALIDDIYDDGIEDKGEEENVPPLDEMPDVVIISEQAKYSSTPNKAANRRVMNSAGAPAQATGATRKRVNVTPKSDRAAMVNKPEMTNAPKRPSRATQAEGAQSQKRWSDGSQAFKGYVSAGQELERRQRMNYVNTNLDGTGPGSSRAPRPAHMEAAMPGSRINRDGSLRDPELNNEAQSRLAIVQNGRARRIVEVEAELQNTDAPVYEDDNIGFPDYAFLFAMERSLRFFMCQACVDFYFNDYGKVAGIGGGYKMLTLVLCPSCVVGNNGLRRFARDNFPTGFNMARNFR